MKHLIIIFYLFLLVACKGENTATPQGHESAYSDLYGRETFSSLCLIGTSSQYNSLYSDCLGRYAEVMEHVPHRPEVVAEIKEQVFEAFVDLGHFKHALLVPYYNLNGEYFRLCSDYILDSCQE